MKERKRRRKMRRRRRKRRKRRRKEIARGEKTGRPKYIRWIKGFKD